MNTVAKVESKRTEEEIFVLTTKQLQEFFLARNDGRPLQLWQMFLGGAAAGFGFWGVRRKKKTWSKI
jgi:hypothetical protein